MYQDIINCICQNTKKLRYIIHYVKPTAQLILTGQLVVITCCDYRLVPYSCGFLT